MRNPHSRRQFGRILPTIRKDDELPVVAICRVRDLSEQTVAKNLADLLEAGSLSSNRRTKISPGPVRVATRADCRIRLIGAIYHRRIRFMHRTHIVQVSSSTADLNEAIIW